MSGNWFPARAFIGSSTIKRSYICYLGEKVEISRPMLEDLATRRQRQAIEGPQAMKEYRQAQQAIYERTAALRKERSRDSSKSMRSVFLFSSRLGVLASIFILLC